MQFIRTIILSLLSLFPINLLSLSNGIFSKNSTIVHLKTGLFFDYVGLYRPSDTIIHNSAIFAMTSQTCRFLPLAVAIKIPSCNVTQRRSKHEILDVISLY